MSLRSSGSHAMVRGDLPSVETTLVVCRDMITNRSRHCNVRLACWLAGCCVYPGDLKNISCRSHGTGRCRTPPCTGACQVVIRCYAEHLLSVRMSETREPQSALNWKTRPSSTLVLHNTNNAESMAHFSKEWVSSSRTKQFLEARRLSLVCTRNDRATAQQQSRPATTRGSWMAPHLCLLQTTAPFFFVCSTVSRSTMRPKQLLTVTSPKRGLQAGAQQIGI